jgi:hypothetical protein
MPAPAAVDSTTNAVRTRTGSMPKRSPRPPATPATTRSSVLRGIDQAGVLARRRATVVGASLAACGVDGLLMVPSSLSGPALAGHVRRSMVLMQPAC